MVAAASQGEKLQWMEDIAETVQVGGSSNSGSSCFYLNILQSLSRKKSLDVNTKIKAKYPLQSKKVTQLQGHLYIN